MKTSYTTYCPIGKAIQIDSQEHKRSYVIDIPAEQESQMTFDQKSELFTSEEKKWQVRQKFDYCQHIKTCDHEECKHMYKIWKAYDQDSPYLK